MKLKMVGEPRPAQKDMILHSSLTGKTYSVEMGKTVEVAEEEGHEFLNRWPKALKLEADSADGKKAPAKDDKKLGDYENKAVVGGKETKAVDKKDDVLG